MPLPPPPNDAIAELASGLGDNDARELVGMFLKSFTAMITGLASSDLEEQRRTAHSLKSSARIVGLLMLSHQMAELEERLGKAGAIITAADVSAAREKFARVEPLLRAYAEAGQAANL